MKEREKRRKIETEESNKMYKQNIDEQKKKGIKYKTNR